VNCHLQTHLIREARQVKLGRQASERGAEQVRCQPRAEGVREWPGERTTGRANRESGRAGAAKE